MWRQDQAVAPGFQPGEAPLHKVDAARHRGKVNPLGGGAALDVGDVGLEHLMEKLKSSITIRSSQDPRVHDAAECGSMRRPGHVVVDHLRDLVGSEVVVETIEQIAQLV